MEGGVDVVVLARGVAHGDPLRAVLEACRAQGAAVRQDEAQVADLEVVVVLVRVDLRPGLGARIDAERQRLPGGDVLERHVDGHGDLSVVEALVEDVQHLVTDEHAVAEEGVGAGGLEGEHRATFECGLGALHTHAVHRDGGRGGVGVAAGGDPFAAGDDLALGHGQADATLIDARDRHTVGLQLRGVRAVGGHDGVLDPPLTGEVDCVDDVPVEVAFGSPQGVRDGLGHAGGPHRHGDRLDLDVVSDVQLDGEVRRRVDLGGGPVLDDGSGGVRGGKHEAGGDLLGGDAAGGGGGGADEGLPVRVSRVDGVLDALVGDRVVRAVQVVVGRVHREPGVRDDLQATRAAVGHAAGVDLHQLGSGREVGAEVGVEVVRCEVVVLAVLDPEHDGLARLDEEGGGICRPRDDVVVGQIVRGVEVVERVVAEVHRFGGRVVDLDELVAVCAVDVRRVRSDLGDLQRRRGQRGIGHRRRLPGIGLRGRGGERVGRDLARGRDGRPLQQRGSGVAVVVHAELCGAARRGRARGIEGPRRRAVGQGEANAPLTAVGHAGLALHAHEAVVGPGALGGPVVAEVLLGAGEAVNGAARVGEPQHDRLARLHQRAGRHLQGDVAGRVVAVRVDVGETGLRQVDGGVAGVPDLDELEVVGARGVRGDLGDHQRRQGGRGAGGRGRERRGHEGGGSRQGDELT